MQGMNIAEVGHVVNALPPIDIAGGASTDRWKMTNYRKASIIVSLGVSAAAPTSILVYEATAATAGTTAAIAFSYQAETTAAGDTLGARTTVAATGITTVTANDTTMYVIDVDARELTDGRPWLFVTINNASGSSVLASVMVVLSGSRYSTEQSATAIV